MLKIENISASYGAVVALEGVSLSIAEGQLVCLLGANGAGKSTTLNTISGIVKATAGSVTFRDQRIDGLSAEHIVQRGIAQVPEGRETFPEMSVEDNLLLGAWIHRHDRKKVATSLSYVFDLFPRLKERRTQHAGLLSGGEQQMLMIGRALMSGPEVLLMDEPSLGLSPVLVERLFETIVDLNRQGLTILIVEQNAKLALDVSQYGYILENGELTAEGPSADLMKDPRVREAYLGS